MENKLDMFLKAREEARLNADFSVMTAMNAELARLGYREPQAGLETTQAVMPERAIPPKPRGRPPRPRCEHGQIVDHCNECKEGEIADAKAAG